MPLWIEGQSGKNHGGKKRKLSEVQMIFRDLSQYICLLFKDGYTVASKGIKQHY